MVVVVVGKWMSRVGLGWLFIAHTHTLTHLDERRAKFVPLADYPEKQSI